MVDVFSVAPVHTAPAPLDPRRGGLPQGLQQVGAPQQVQAQAQAQAYAPHDQAPAYAAAPAGLVRQDMGQPMHHQPLHAQHNLHGVTMNLARSAPPPQPQAQPPPGPLLQMLNQITGMGQQAPPPMATYGGHGLQAGGAPVYLHQQQAQPAPPPQQAAQQGHTTLLGGPGPGSEGALLALLNSLQSSLPPSGMAQGGLQHATLMQAPPQQQAQGQGPNAQLAALLQQLHGGGNPGGY